jgi:hypothetical protein
MASAPTGRDARPPSRPAYPFRVTTTSRRAPSENSVENGDHGPLVIASLSVLWFGATLWFTHRSITSALTPDLGLAAAALALAQLIGRGLLAGAAVAVAITTSGRTRSARWRLLVGTGAGLVVGAAAGGLIVIGYGTAQALVALALAIAVSAALGGALSGVRVPAVVAAGLAGLLAWYGVGLLEGLFNGRLQRVFAADSSPDAQFAAAGRLSLAIALAGGVAAGLTAYRYLRRRDGGLSWPAYLIAGGTPGLLLLVADLATRLGGGPLLRVAGRGVAADRVALAYVGEVRLSTALVVLFVGAITTLIAFGRTLKR